MSLDMGMHFNINSSFMYGLEKPVSFLQASLMDYSIAISANQLPVQSDEQLSAAKSTVRKVASAHSQANKAYINTRSWNFICWQPIYLAICSIFRHDLIFNGHSLLLTSNNGNITGCSLDVNSFALSDSSQRKAQFSSQVFHYISRLFDDVQSLINLKHRSAINLAKDCVLHALLAFRKKNSPLNIDALNTYANEWFREWDNPIERQHFYIEKSLILVNRHSCCMHYLIEQGGRCSDCPKQRKQK